MPTLSLNIKIKTHETILIVIITARSYNNDNKTKNKVDFFKGLQRLMGAGEILCISIRGLTRSASALH